MRATLHSSIRESSLKERIAFQCVTFCTRINDANARCVTVRPHLISADDIWNMQRNWNGFLVEIYNWMCHCKTL